MSDGDWDVDEDCGRLFIGEDESVILTFQNEGESGIDKYKNNAVFFDVVSEEGDGVFSVTSKRLLRKLKKLRPLTHKTFLISRSGHGFDTRYRVREES